MQNEEIGGPRPAAIHELLSRIETRMQEQGNFSAPLSHEVIGLITSIRGGTEVLIRRPREVEEYESKIKRTIAQIDRITVLLDNVFLLSWLRSREITVDRKPVNLYSLLNILEDKWLYHLYTSKMSLHLHVPAGVAVQADCYLLQVILDNLIGYAVHCGKAWGNIYAEWNDESGTLAISNDGYGLANDSLARVLERYLRLDSSVNEDMPGIGLSMGITMTAAALIQTPVRFMAIEGRGASFSLQFSSR